MARANNQDISGGKQYDYLDTADTAGRPMALPSILFTLLFIAAIALLLFSTGKWAYNRFIQEDTSVATTSGQAGNEETSTTGEATTGTNEQNGSTSGEGSSGAGDTAGGTNNTQSSTSTGLETQGTNNPGSSSETQGTNNSGSSTSVGTGDASSATQNGNSGSSTASATTPTTGAGAPEAVPNTGPEYLLAIFVLSVVIGAIAHNRWIVLKR